MPSELRGLLRQLTWNDFTRKLPNPPAGSAGLMAETSASAATLRQVEGERVPGSSGLFRIKDNITIAIQFNAGASWVLQSVFSRPQQFQQDLLKHEQGHYKIVALMARDMFIELMQLKPRTFSSAQDLGQAVNAIRTRFSSAVTQRIEDKYDEPSQSDHGRSASGQARWDGFLNTAFTQARTPAIFAPDGTPYKTPLLDVLRGAGITI